MAARFLRLLVALGLVLGSALPSAGAAAVVCLTASQQSAASVVPARGADAANARSYFGARYLRADLGRFTTVDPVYTWSENLVDPQRWNRYSYVRNNPLRWVDPDGNSPTLVTAAVGAGIGFVAGVLGSVGAQFVSNDCSFSNFNLRDAGAAGLGGAVSGGLAGATLGLSLIAETGAAGIVVVSAGTNAVGGAVTRAADSRSATRVLDPNALLFDTVAGAAGGVVGAQVSVFRR